VATSFVGTRSVEFTAALAIASERAHERLRLEQGVTYGIDGSYVRMTADLAHAHIGADCTDERAAGVRDGLQAVIDEVADDGPTEAELERHVSLTRRSMTAHDAALPALDVAALDRLFGSPRETPAEVLRRVEALTPGGVTTAMSEAAETQILLGPSDLEELPTGFERYGQAADPPVEGRTFRFRRERLRRPKAALVLAEEGLSLVQPDAEPITVPFDDCVAIVSEAPGRYTVLSRDESFVEFDVNWVRDGAKLLDGIRARVPEALWVPPDPDAQDA
jgi:hypothetical protein